MSWIRLRQLTGFFRQLQGRVTQVLRRLALQGVVPLVRAGEVVHDLLDLRITRDPHRVLLPRIWQLRHNLSA